MIWLYHLPSTTQRYVPMLITRLRPALFRRKQPTKEGLLYNSKHITVSFVDFQSDNLFISFNEMGLKSNGYNFWGKSFFVKEQMSAIGIVSKQPNWYPPADMRKATKRINAFIKRVSPKAIVTYGCSQGGYGAIKYARALNADAAVAFSPQFSIDPETLGSADNRFTNYFNPKLKGGLKIEPSDLCQRNYIFFDRHNVYDKKNAHMIAACGPVFLINVPFTGHGPICLVSDGGIGRTLLDEIASQGGRSAVLRSLLRSARHKSHIYFRERARWLNEHKRSPVLINHAVDLAAKLLPDDIGWCLDFIALQIKTGNFDYARGKIHGVLLQLDYKKSEHRCWGKALARFLEEIGNCPEARQVLAQIDDNEANSQKF